MGKQVGTQLLRGKYEYEAVALNGAVIKFDASKEPAQIIYRMLDPLDFMCQKHANRIIGRSQAEGKR